MIKEPITRCAQCGAYVYKSRPCTTCNEPEDKYAWQERASCLGLDTELFFPERRGDRSRDGEIIYNKEIAYALKVCADCPVRGKCLEYGLQDDYGIFGGLLPQQRRALRARVTRRKGNGR